MKTITVNSQDLGNVATIDTYGTYNGELVDDEMIEHYNEEHRTDYNYDDFDWNYDHKAIVKDLAELRAKFLENNCEAIEKCVVKSTGSPMYYNYSTDYAMFEITYNEKLVNEFVEKNKEEFKSWYSESGWWSSTEWREDDDPRLEENREIARLDYYLNKTINYDDSYWALAEREDEIYWEHTTMERSKQ